MEKNTKGKSRATYTLEVEDDDTRQARLGSILEKLNSDSTSSKYSARPPFDFGDRTTFTVQPPSELLARVQAFLPQIESANAETAHKLAEDPEAIDIESLDPSLDQYIEMNLGLGVFEDRSGRATGDDSSDEDEDDDMSAKPSDTSSDASDETSTATSSDSDSLISSDSNKDEEATTLRPKRPLPKRARPLIEVIDDGTTSRTSI